jgi:recombinational DNA repair protein RecT
MDGLLCDGREAVLTLFNAKVKDVSNGKEVWVKKAQYMPMVEGFKKKAFESGKIESLSIQVVRENDTYDYELGDNERIIHKPALKQRGEIIAAYSIAKLSNGSISREWMGLEEIEEVRKRSKSPDYGPWKSDYSEMCRKTVFRRHYKSLPKTPEADTLIMHDNDTYNVDDYTREVITQEPVASKTESLKAKLKNKIPADASEVSSPAGVVGEATPQKDGQAKISPGTNSSPVPDPSPKPLPAMKVPALPDGSGANWDAWGDIYLKEVAEAPHQEWLQKFMKDNESRMSNLRRVTPALADRLSDALIARIDSFNNVG